jgi:integrase
MAIRKIEKRVLPSGLISYRAPYVDSGGRRRSQNFATKGEAEEFLRRVGNELAMGTHTPASTSPTVAEAAPLWIKSCNRKALEPTTIQAYQEHIDLHILPFIGTMKLVEVTSPAVIAFADTLHEAGRSPDMIGRVISSLGQIFTEARSRGLIATAPTVGVDLKLPDGSRDNPRPTIPAKAELRAIIDGAIGRGPGWRAFFLVAIFCGLRASELRGLPWKDVDLTACEINVTQRADIKHRIGRLKSKAGYRTIPLPPMVVSALREWKLQCPKGELELVFPNGVGRIEALSNIMRRVFDPIQVAARITVRREQLDKEGKPVRGKDGKVVMEIVAKYAMHALRHACASLWIEQGLLPKRIQVLMGHSTIQMTYDRYGHLFKDEHADQRAAEAVQNGLLPGTIVRS